MDTVKPFADANHYTIEIMDDLRERKTGSVWIEDFNAFCKQQWSDFSYKLLDGESLFEVQKRNISALNHILRKYEHKTVVVGSHGTALSTIINYFDSSFGYEAFAEIKSLMPWIVKFVFDSGKLQCIEKIDLFSKKRCF